jgi:hypothetical protein
MSSYMAAPVGKTIEGKPVSVPTPYATVPTRPVVQTSMWGSYNKPASYTNNSAPAPAPTTPTRRFLPNLIQGFKPAQPAQPIQPVAVQPTGMPMPMPSPSAPVNLSPTQLQQRVASACGGMAQSVVVSKQSNGTLLVEVKVRSPKEADDVSGKVLPLPEMLSSQAALKIVIGQ